MGAVKRFALSLIPALIAGAVIGAVFYAFDIEAKSTLGMVLIALAGIAVLSIAWAGPKSPHSN